mgnify:CR=1 FL=1
MNTSKNSKSSKNNALMKFSKISKKLLTCFTVFLCAFSLVGCSNTSTKTDTTKTDTKKTTSSAVVEKGDVVKIDFVGKVNGKEFDGGSASDYVLEVGSGTFIDGFEDQLIGHKTNENFNVKVLFPEDYGVDNLNGEEATFKTSIQKIYKEAK